MQQNVYVVLILTGTFMLLDGDQLPLFQKIDPILYRTHGDTQFRTHLVHRRSTLTTTAGTAHQIRIDFECVHIQWHIEHIVGKHQEL